VQTIMFSELISFENKRDNQINHPHLLASGKSKQMPADHRSHTTLKKVATRG